MRFTPLLLAAALAAGSQTRRSEPRDQAASQRHQAAPQTSRSTAARHAFQRSHPCPATHKTSGACPGYVIDHITPLKRGGPDTPANMQWQTAAEAKAKDKIE